MRRCSLLLCLALVIGANCASAMVVTIDAHNVGGNRPQIVGHTNLPDGTELMIAVRRPDIKFMAQDKTIVRGGSFQSAQFSDKARDLMPGSYIIEITMSIPTFQAPSVRAVVGAHGEKMTGPLVRPALAGDKMIEYKTSFAVAGQSTEKEVAARKAQSERDMEKWKQQACIDSCKMTAAYAEKKGERFDYRSCLAKCPNR